VCAGENASQLAAEFRAGAAEINQAVNTHLWDGRWFGRGITDNGVVFGVSKDNEGRIFLNMQSWAMLSGAANEAQRKLMLQAIAEQLDTPYGPMILAPAFTAMRDDIGRVTQKYPGSAENGSVYNHAAVFHIYSLYSIGEADRAFRLIRQMLPGPDIADYLQRGQLPVFIPNYYRGAYRQHPRTAGRSSQLFNTGTVAWLYRCLVEGLIGLKGDKDGLVIQPQLPSHWSRAKVTREFRGATFEVEMRREKGVSRTSVVVDGQELQINRVTDIQAGKAYKVEVRLPA
jgi:cellobionic acid phosphorylase